MLFSGFLKVKDEKFTMMLYKKHTGCILKNTPGLLAIPAGYLDF
jgi:hypothetical protein